MTILGETKNHRGSIGSHKLQTMHCRVSGRTRTSRRRKANSYREKDLSTTLSRKTPLRSHRILLPFAVKRPMHIGLSNHLAEREPNEQSERIIWPEDKRVT